MCYILCVVYLPKETKWGFCNEFSEGRLIVCTHSLFQYKLNFARKNVLHVVQAIPHILLHSTITNYFWAQVCYFAHFCVWLDHMNREQFSILDTSKMSILKGDLFHFILCLSNTGLQKVDLSWFPHFAEVFANVENAA